MNYTELIKTIMEFSEKPKNSIFRWYALLAVVMSSAFFNEEFWKFLTFLIGQ